MKPCAWDFGCRAGLLAAVGGWLKWHTCVASTLVIISGGGRVALHKHCKGGMKSRACTKPSEGRGYCTRLRGLLNRVQGRVVQSKYSEEVV